MEWNMEIIEKCVAVLLLYFLFPMVILTSFRLYEKLQYLLGYLIFWCFIYIMRIINYFQNDVGSSTDFKDSNNFESPSNQKPKPDLIEELVNQLWPHVNNYVRDTLRPALNDYMYREQWLSFNRLDVGLKPGNIKNHLEISSHHMGSNIQFTLDLSYSGDCDAAIKWWFIPIGGIQHIKFKGRIHIDITPIDKLPFISNISIYFIEQPDIDFSTSGIVSWKKTQTIKDLSEVIYQACVIPNKVTTDIPQFCVKNVFPK